MEKSKIKTIVVEDEREDTDLMLNLLKEYPEIEIVDTASDIEEGISKISFHKPELIFLDINLYGRLSFEILDVIYNLNLKPKIIFTTAFNDFMIKAFKYSAFDYLLKPVDRKELTETISRFMTQKKQKDFNDGYKKLKETRKKLIFNTSDGFEIINPEDICYITTVKNQAYSEFFLMNDRIIISKNIGEIEKMLGETSFFKVHRSFIINLNFITKINRIKKKCILKADECEYEVPVSREKLKILTEKLKKIN